MKLAMIKVNLDAHPAVVLQDGRCLDLKIASTLGLLEDFVPSRVEEILGARNDFLTPVRRLLEAVEGGAASSVDPLLETGGLLSDWQTALLPPLQPNLILCTGGSYLDHVREMGVEPPKAPGAFIKAPHTVTGPRAAILLPVNAPSMIDFECEFCCVFDRRCHNVEPEEALDYIGGFTMINDVSARDDVADWFGSLTQNNPRRTCEIWDRVVLGKQYPTFCPLGPVVATKDEIPDPHDVHIKTVLNGTVMQSAHTADLAFSIGKIISHFSRWHTFDCGDVLSTGSPSGVGFARNPKVFLKVGDVVEVEGTGIGSLSNGVAATLT